MRVLWLANIPSPYRVDFFNELGNRCDLTVLFEKRFSSERDDSWKNFNTKNFNAVFLVGKSVGVAEAFCPTVVKYLKDEYDHIVVTNFSDPTGILAICYMKLKRIPYEIEGDGAFPGAHSGIKAMLKTFLFNSATRYFSTAKLHDQYYLQYRAESTRIFRYPFSSISERDILRYSVSLQEKEVLKNELSISEKYMILAVGQFVTRKGFDILIKAAAKLDINCGVYIVGGKAPDEYESLKKSLGLENVYFVGFKQQKELKKYYKASDVFVHPTREDIWGLVINEAMAFGLPVVTTEKCIAGLEMVHESENGFIIQVGDVEATAQAIKKCIENKCKMCVKSLQIAHEYTIEKMADRHIDVWKKG